MVRARSSKRFIWVLCGLVNALYGRFLLLATAVATRDSMDSLTSPPLSEQYRCTCSPVMSSALPAPSATPADEWDYLEWNVLKPSRSSSVCMTCQHFRYQVGRHCVTLLTGPIHQGLIPQGEHLTRRCAQWVRRQEVKRVWRPEAG